MGEIARDRQRLLPIMAIGSPGWWYNIGHEDACDMEAFATEALGDVCRRGTAGVQRSRS